MASMEDLVATLSCGMHVGQDAYDLERIKAHLARTLVLPVIPVPLSPVSPSRPLPASRSQSRSRPPPSVPYYVDASHVHAHTQPYPSSPADRLFGMSDDAGAGLGLTPGAGGARPVPTRMSSYGFAAAAAAPGTLGVAQTQSEPSSPSAGMLSAGSTSGFESDAFAPLWQEQCQASAWAGALAEPKARAAALSAQAAAPSPWAAFHAPSTSAFTGFGQAAAALGSHGGGFAQASPAPVAYSSAPHSPARKHYAHAPPAHAYGGPTTGPLSPPMDVDDDERMDEDGALDTIDDALDEDEDERARFGAAASWQRGRW